MPKTPKLSPIGKLCHKAADIIEKKGWCQGVYWQPDGKLCLVGALRQAASGDALAPSYEAGEAVGALGLAGQVAQWNDAPKRTKEEVLARLRSVS